MIAMFAILLPKSSPFPPLLLGNFEAVFSCKMDSCCSSSLILLLMSFNISELRGKGEAGRGEDVGEVGLEEGVGDVGEDTGGVEGSDEEEEDSVESEPQGCIAVECFILT